jgi:hypothetical protein
VEKLRDAGVKMIMEKVGFCICRGARASVNFAMPIMGRGGDRRAGKGAEGRRGSWRTAALSRRTARAHIIHLRLLWVAMGV